MLWDPRGDGEFGPWPSDHTSCCCLVPTQTSPKFILDLLPLPEVGRGESHVHSLPRVDVIGQMESRGLTSQPGS